MQVESGTDAAAFAAAALPWLERDPFGNGLLISVAQAQRDAPGEFHGVLVRAADGVLAGAAAWTPPWPVLLSVMAPPAAAAVADRLLDDGGEPTSVHGPVGAADAFAARWSARTGGAVGARLGVVVYRLDVVIAPVGVRGSARTAGPADRELLVRWMREFDASIHLGAGGDPAVAVDARLGHGRLALWEDGGRPVAMAAVTPRVAGVPRMTHVYTPPEHRRRGYAGALVAHLSARELATGAPACMLNTEASNVTSNGVYRRLGYRPVGETVQIRLG